MLIRQNGTPVAPNKQKQGILRLRREAEKAVAGDPGGARKPSWERLPDLYSFRRLRDQGFQGRTPTSEIMRTR